MSVFVQVFPLLSVIILVFISLYCWALDTIEITRAVLFPSGRGNNCANTVSPFKALLRSPGNIKIGDSFPIRSQAFPKIIGQRKST